MNSIYARSIAPLVIFLLFPTCATPLVVEAPALLPEMEGPPIPAPRFGVVVGNANQDWQIIETRSIPLANGVVYGWAIFVPRGDRPIPWEQHLQLPGPSKHWPSPENFPNLSVSPTGDRAIFQGLTPGGGYVTDTWTVSEEDAEGPAFIEVAVGEESYRFEFKFVRQAISQPEVALPSLIELANRCRSLCEKGGAITQCNIESAPYPALTAFLQGEYVENSRFKEFLSEVAEPFCAATQESTRSALILVENGVRYMVINCRNQEGSGWMEVGLRRL